MKNIKKEIETLSLIVFLFISINAFSQEKELETIKFKVEESKNNPLPGVSIYEKGTSNGTTTNFEGEAFQLRGMATAHSFQGKGIGNKLVNFAIVYLRGQHINYVWCNARQKAFKFYTSLGFEFISDFFDIPNIGPHKQMYLKIR